MKIKQKLLNLAWVFLDLVSLLSQAPWYNTPPRNSELPLYLLPSLLLNAVIFLVAVLCPFFFCLVYSPHVSYDLLPCMLSTQLCPTLCDPINCSPPQAPLSLEFSRQEYWNVLSFSPPGELPDPEIKPLSPASPTPLSHLGRPWFC